MRLSARLSNLLRQNTSYFFNLLRAAVTDIYRVEQELKSALCAYDIQEHIKNKQTGTSYIIFL